MAHRATIPVCRKAFSFWNPSSLTFEAWIWSESPSMRLMPGSRQISAPTVFAVIKVSLVYCGSESRKSSSSNATTISLFPTFSNISCSLLALRGKEFKKREMKLEDRFLAGSSSDNQAAMRSLSWKLKNMLKLLYHQLLTLNAGTDMVGVCQEVTILHHVSPCIPERQQATR